MATQQLLIKGTSGLPTQYTPLTTSAGSASAGQVPALNGSGQIDSTMLPASTGLPSLSLTASGAIAANSFVSINSSGQIVAASAASTSAPAVGFCPNAISSGSSGTVQFAGTLCTGQTGLTPGAPVYLSATTAGASSSTAPSTAGQLIQQIGFAITATEFVFVPHSILVN